MCVCVELHYFNWTSNANRLSLSEPEGDTGGPRRPQVLLAGDKLVVGVFCLESHRSCQYSACRYSDVRIDIRRECRGMPLGCSPVAVATQILMKMRSTFE